MNHFQQSQLICPHCDHEFTSDEMNSFDVDLWALAPAEERECIECPVCDAEFWVAGTYKPLYTTALAEEDLLTVTEQHG